MFLLLIAMWLVDAAVDTAWAKTKAPPARVVTTVGRLDVVAPPGDSLWEIAIDGTFTELPVLVCTPANVNFVISCQALTLTSGAIGIHNPDDFLAPVTVNWHAAGD